MKKKKWTLALLIVLIAACLSAAGILIWGNFIDHSGWILRGGHYYCLTSEGEYLTGFQTLDGVTYCFAPDGRMQTGLCAIDGKTYYFGTDGAMRRGPCTIDGAGYCFGPDGAQLTGWVEVNGRRCFYDPDGRMHTGWLEDTWFLSESGTPVTGAQEQDGTKYFFDEAGRRTSGWADTDEGRFYFLPEGGVATGRQVLDGKLYLFTDFGTPITGWYTEGHNTYYLTEDGAAVGPRIIDGQLHYFSPLGIEVILVNTSHKIPAGYNPNIVTFLKDHKIVDYAKEPLERMFAAMEASGIKYTLNSIYRTRSQQQEILRLRTSEYQDKGYSYEAAYAKARQTVALPDTSEHQLGLAADILGKEANDWLAEHCWEYGFILRYPGAKAAITGIANESWHFRYVGVEVAMDMKNTGLCLEEYLGAAPTAE